ncbi:hypothetical protein RHMOL_Rhmol07G0087900 [Rhododendron molle]|uniref:Uncharacterized protein n=1 Tax=Rhododendron molle TaxID=49168 RepID=A0ACC0N0K1_RHOML|nr:hypothetical protein RHMOL_Rhmol07G0087900 [Rhododendron molle]
MSTKYTPGYNTLPSNSRKPPLPPPPSTPSTFISRAKTHTQTLVSARRPWKELLDPSSLSLPDSYTDAMARVRRNLYYFRFNYTLITLIIVFLSLVYHPISMIVFLVVFIAWFFLYFFRDDPIALFGRAIDDRVVLGVLGVVTVVALGLAGVGLNVLVALVIGVVVVGLHSVFRVTGDLFLDEEEIWHGLCDQQDCSGHSSRPSSYCLFLARRCHSKTCLNPDNRIQCMWHGCLAVSGKRAHRAWI